MIRVLKALGLATAGFLICMIVPRVVLLFGSRALFGYLTTLYIVAPLVGFSLFLVYFYKTDPAAGQRSKSGPGKLAFHVIRLFLPTVLSGIIAYFSLSVIRDLTVKNDHHSGDTWNSFGAGILTYFLAPVVAIATFLLIYWVIGMFAPKTTGFETSEHRL